MLTLETIAWRGKEGKILTPNETVTKSHFHISEKKRRKYNAILFISNIDFEQLNTGGKWIVLYNYFVKHAQ